jgi:hypothetical protein
MIRRPMLAAMTLLILHLCALPALAAEDAQVQAGVLEDLRGTVTARQEAGQPRAIPKGGPVLVKDILTTGPEDRGKIVFADDSVLEIGPDSEIRIEEFAYDTADRDNSRQGLRWPRAFSATPPGKSWPTTPTTSKSNPPGLHRHPGHHHRPYGHGPGDHPGRRARARGRGRTARPAPVQNQNQVVVTHLNKPTVLKKQDMAASLKPKTPAVSRPLTEAEKKTFATIPSLRPPSTPGRA